MDASIYRGEVVHKRLSPVEHKLKYKVFSLLVDVDQLKDINSKHKLFSVDRWSLFSLHQIDHGYRDGRSISHFAWDIVENCGLLGQVRKIRMLFYPRILGYAFNPLTTYFCEDREGNPLLMIYEVRNTFGENLTYVVPAGPSVEGTFAHSTKKKFYVSPFNQVDGDYTFHIRSSSEEKLVGVALKLKGAPMLRTHFRGREAPMRDSELFKVFCRYPMMTLKIMAGIHWDALKLWRKGLSITERPAPPINRIEFCDGKL